MGSFSANQLKTAASGKRDHSLRNAKLLNINLLQPPDIHTCKELQYVNVQKYCVT